MWQVGTISVLLEAITYIIIILHYSNDSDIIYLSILSIFNSDYMILLCTSIFFYMCTF